MLEVSTSYRPMQNPATPGEVRSKRWSMAFCNGPQDAQDPVWIKRCQDYWRRQQELYGLEFGNFTVSVVPPQDGEPAQILTSSVVLRVLPGERVKSMMGAN